MRYKGRFSNQSGDFVIYIQFIATERLIYTHLLTVLFQLCYGQEVGINSATTKCYNTSKLTWQTDPLKEYKEYFFKVRSCIKEEKRCSPFTAKKMEKTGPEREYN